MKMVLPAFSFMDPCISFGTFSSVKGRDNVFGIRAISPPNQYLGRLRVFRRMGLGTRAASESAKPAAMPFAVIYGHAPAVQNREQSA